MAKAMLKKTCGSCAAVEIGPSPITSGTKMANVMITFEEALKLQAAIAECVQRLHRYGRSTKSGNQKMVSLSVQLHANRVCVDEWP
jgi:hypothetical protein